ncbi:MAG TPA: hypothetical protein VEW46_09820 [Pyrinomonadaceae bacterium]|nr:hypothetical protein [Pyrinomonadaceae bacterium]
MRLADMINEHPKRRIIELPTMANALSMTNEKWKMIYGKSLTLFVLIIVSASVVCAQESQCTTKLADLPAAPELMGFRMGMTTDQVKARVPQVLFGKADDFGVAKTSINPDFDTRIDKSTFPGVRTVSLDFLDGRLTSLWLGFDGSFKWKTVPEFVKGISQSLRVPDSWSSWRTRGQQIRCADFQLTVMIVAEGPSFRIIDEAAEQTVTARRQAKEEQAEGEEQEQTDAVMADKKSKVYYPHGCEPDKEIKEADRIVFGTREGAEQAGYKVAKSCPH